MANPVVHFEINAKDGKRAQKFFGDLFGWHVDTNNPMGYGIVDTHADGKGIGGGIGQTSNDSTWVTFYVQVDDVGKYLERAQRLGGKTLVPPMKPTPDVEIALFADPEGNVIGLTKGM